jgi:NitT/TauT family transport system ATP-binding protein
MQRRAELARALANRPTVMMLDEPFRGLDALTRRLMVEYYAELSIGVRSTEPGSAQTTLFVTTDVDEAILLADRLFVMSHIPTKVEAVIEVDLPRPRTLRTLFESERAREIKKAALALLHAEAMKAFAGGSRATADFIEAYRRRFAR